MASPPRMVATTKLGYLIPHLQPIEAERCWQVIVQYTYMCACMHVYFCIPSVPHAHKHTTLDIRLQVSIAPCKVWILFEMSLTWLKVVGSEGEGTCQQA